MAYIVIRTIRGRQYRYLQESYRVPGKKNPRTRTTYLGPVRRTKRSGAGCPSSPGLMVFALPFMIVHDLVSGKRVREFKARLAQPRGRGAKSTSKSAKDKVLVRDMKDFGPRIAASQKGAATSSKSMPTAADEASLAGRIQSWDNWSSQQQEAYNESDDGSGES